MTYVVFKKFKGEIIALFPHEIADPYGNIMSYVIIGQHGAASPTLLKCRNATPVEYAETLSYLIRQGYDDLIILNGKTRKLK